MNPQKKPTMFSGYSSYDDLLELVAYNRYISETRALIEGLIPEIKGLVEKNRQDEKDKGIPDVSKLVEQVVMAETLKIYYNSILISLYSFFERKLASMCRHVESRHAVKLKHISGNGIHKCRTYLEKVQGIDFNSINRQWQYIKSMGEIRNILVHKYEQVISADKEALITFVDSNENFESFRREDNSLEFKITDKEIIIEMSDPIKKVLKYISSH